MTSGKLQRLVTATRFCERDLTFWVLLTGTQANSIDGNDGNGKLTDTPAGYSEDGYIRDDGE